MVSFCNRVEVCQDDTNPNVYWIEPTAVPILVQVTVDQYEVWQGRRILGVIIFHDGPDRWGWRFFPRQMRKRPGRVLHPNPEAALKGRRITIHSVITDRLRQKN
jgi:hypothetical protein